MNCWYCERPAHGICNFCGRSICKDHIQSLPSILSIYRNKNEKLKAIVVDDTLYCGICKPKETPITIDEIDQ